MTLNMVPTFYARIYLGLRVGYTDQMGTIEDVEEVCAEYCKIGLCVTVTPTKYIYTNGWDPGVIIGFIRYPRFPKTTEEIEHQALELAGQLRTIFKQERVSVEFPDRTVMLGDL